MIKTVVWVMAASLFAANALAAGNADAGKSKTVACGACHGADGNSLAPTFPKLAGQHPGYLLKQLKDIKSGARSVPAMTGQLDALNDQDFEDIAAYYAAQKATPGMAKEQLVALGERVYRAGIRDKGVAACTACHSPIGAGNAAAGFPSLSGQHADYIAASLRAFRNDERTNDGDTRIMRDVANHLSDKEVDAVASYASGLH